jgi:hypothetical protein
MPFRCAVLCAVGCFAAFAGASCDAENTNDVGCAPVDCTSSCESFGFAGGACEDDACVCDDSDTDPFEWDGGSDADTDSDADSDADSDSDTDADTDADADVGAKLG